MAIGILACTSLFGCGRGERALEQDVMAPWEGLKTINGSQLYVKAVGEGDPVLVIHGGPGWDHSIFLPHVQPLSSDFRLIFFDQRASGRSSIADVDPADMTIPQFLEDIDGLRQEFGLETVTLMGHSFGGRLAMQYAIAYPDRVKSLILVNPTAASSEYVDRVNKTMQERMTPADRMERDRLVAAGALKGESPELFTQLMRIFLSTNFHDPARAGSLNLYVPDRFEARGEMIEALSTNASPYDFHAELPRIRVPTLILRGDSEALPMQATARIHESIASSRLVEFKDCGHFPFVERTAEFLKAVRSFRDDVNRQEGMLDGADDPADPAV